MPHRHEDSVLGNQRAVAVRIHASEITDVVPVRLEPANHVKFVTEKVTQKVVDRPVVTHFVSAADRVSRIKTVPAVVVVSLPGCVGRLHQNVGMAGIVAHDKNYGTRLAGIQP